MSTVLYSLRAGEVSEKDAELIRARFPARFARAERFTRAEDRLSVIAAGVLLHRALGIEDEGLIRINAEGRPYLPGGHDFSISHSGGVCVLAVGRERVGVDIERIDGSNLIACPASLTDEELSWIAPAPLERFHLLWTRKESIYKAIGGFSDPKEINALEGKQPEGLYVKSVLLPGFALSVCAGEDPGEIGPISFL